MPGRSSPNGRRARRPRRPARSTPAACSSCATQRVRSPKRGVGRPAAAPGRASASDAPRSPPRRGDDVRHARGERLPVAGRRDRARSAFARRRRTPRRDREQTPRGRTGRPAPAPRPRRPRCAPSPRRTTSSGGVPLAQLGQRLQGGAASEERSPRTRGSIAQSPHGPRNAASMAHPGRSRSAPRARGERPLARPAPAPARRRAAARAARGRPRPASAGPGSRRAARRQAWYSTAPTP